MRRMPLIVSHYTIDTGYEQEVKNLIGTLKKFGLDYFIEPIKTLGSWRMNSNYCSRLVQKAMADYPDRDILRVDADARFDRCPKLFEQNEWNNVDVGYVRYSFKWIRNELLGGTLFFANNPHVRWLVDEWTKKCMVECPHAKNPVLLDKLLKNEFKGKIKVKEMPPQYCKIFDHMSDIKNGVIVHYQASRRFKKIVNRMGRS